MFKSKRILNVIDTARQFKCRPSDILGIDEDEIYCRYCIDEACAYLFNRIQPDGDGKCEEPIFIEDIEQSKVNNPGLELLMK